jgi:hypothetical protein
MGKPPPIEARNETGAPAWRKGRCILKKLYALFMNFLPAFYEFSNVMEFDHQGKAAMNMICPFSQIEQTVIG